MRFAKSNGGEKGKKLFKHETTGGRVITCWASSIQEAVWLMRKVDQTACMRNVVQVSFDNCELVSVFSN